MDETADCRAPSQQIGGKPESHLESSGFASLLTHRAQNYGLLRNGIILVVFFAVFFLSITGAAEKIVGKLIMVERVSQENQKFLKSSLGSAVGHFTLLSLAKGGVEVLSNIQADAKPVGVGVGVPIGKIFSGLSETLDAIWRFFGYSIASITAQMAILKFFKLVSFKILIPIGALLIAVSAIGFIVLRKFGVALMIVGFILYLLMPYTLCSGLKA